MIGIGVTIWKKWWNLLEKLWVPESVIWLASTQTLYHEKKVRMIIKCGKVHCPFDMDPEIALNLAHHLKCDAQSILEATEPKQKIPEEMIN